MGRRTDGGGRWVDGRRGRWEDGRRVRWVDGRTG